jgi:hypothetical protein
VVESLKNMQVALEAQKQQSDLQKQQSDLILGKPIFHA